MWIHYILPNGDLLNKRQRYWSTLLPFWQREANNKTQRLERFCTAFMKEKESTLWQNVKQINGICNWKRWRNWKCYCMTLPAAESLRGLDGVNLERPDSSRRPQSSRQDFCESLASSRRQEAQGIYQLNRNWQEKTNLKHSSSPLPLKKTLHRIKSSHPHNSQKKRK